MEERKQKEVDYYARVVKKIPDKIIKGNYDFEGFDLFLLRSHLFVRDILEKECSGKKVLDYGCGNGVYSVLMAQFGAKVTAIDISPDLIKVAKERAEEMGLGGQINFMVMDCENLKFPDNYFDIVFESRTLPSLNLERAIAEIKRVLIKDGVLIGLEPLSHNPIIGLKRRINIFTGKRTEWESTHILKMADLEKISTTFTERKIYFFHLFSWLIFPLLRLPGSKNLLKLFERVDTFTLRLFPVLNKYSFKVVFVFFYPKK